MPSVILPDGSQRNYEHALRVRDVVEDIGPGLLKAALADTPLVQNLKNDKYMEIILNGCSSLAERFSQIDAYQVQQEMENAAKSNDKILPAIKKLIKDAELTLKISALFCPSVAK